MSEALSAGTVSLPVKPNTSDFGKHLSDGILGQSDGLRGIGGKIAGTIMAGVAAVGIGVGIAKIFHTGFDEAKDASAGIAQLTAGIKSTGNAANVSVKGMTDLASSIQGVSGQTDDSVVKAEQLLLTFTDIKNVGADKIFDQATQAAADMAAKFGGDASSQAILLGKALNDPVKGITALTRVGVSFTQGQKDTIAALVKTGDTVGAQKVILGELNKEFGGAAAAAGQSLPGSLARARRSFEDISQSIVEGFLPIVTPAIVGVANALVRATPSVEAFSNALSGKLTAAVQIAVPAVKGLFELFVKGNYTADLGAALGISEDSPVVGIILSIRDTLTGAFSAIWSAMAPVFVAIGSAFAQLWPTIQPLLPQLMQLAVALSPVHLIFTALAPVLPTLIGTLGQLAATLAGALGQALSMILPVITQVAGMLAGQLASVVKMLIPIIVQLVGVIGPVLGTVLQALAPLLTLIVGFIGQLLGAVMPLIPVVLQLVMAFVPLLTPLIQLVGAILTPLIQLLSAILTPVMALVTGLVGFLVPAINAIIKVITWLITNVIAAFKIEFGAVAFVVTHLGDIVGLVFNTIGSNIRGAFNGVVDFVKGIFNNIIGIVNNIIDSINGATSLAGAIGIHIGAIPHLPRLAEGATVLPKPGGTPVVLAEAGRPETVVDTGKLNRRLDQDDERGGRRGGDILPNATIHMTADKSVSEYAQELAWFVRNNK